MATTANRFDLIVLGSTLAGLSAAIGAARRGQRVLLLEAGTIAGYDFVETLQMQRGWTLPADAGEFAAEVHGAARQRQIIVGDRCDTAAFACLLQDFLAKSTVSALYLTDVTAVVAPRAGQSGFKVTYSNRSGISTVGAERLVDATLDATGLRALGTIEAEQPAAGWAFRGLLLGVDLPAEGAPTALPSTGQADLTVSPGRYATDLVVELQGRGPAAVGAARVELLQRIGALRETAAWKPYTVATLANLVAATPRFSLKTGALEGLEAAGFNAVAAWRQPALATAPWAAVAAGSAAGAGQLAAAR